jgi:hypothetical protein
MRTGCRGTEGSVLDISSFSRQVTRLALGVGQRHEDSRAR